MEYVKQFNINGIDTKQVACIELKGAPNAATEGCVGVLGIDTTSPTHDVYKCVARNGSVYTWELLSSGMSFLYSRDIGYGKSTMEFPYSTIAIPDKYVIKVGDLIFDKEGYIYQISSIGSTSCNATYCGTRIGVYRSSQEFMSTGISIYEGVKKGQRTLINPYPSEIKQVKDISSMVGGYLVFYHFFPGITGANFTINFFCNREWVSGGSTGNKYSCNICSYPAKGQDNKMYQIEIRIDYGQEGEDWFIEPTNILLYNLTEGGVTVIEDTIGTNGIGGTLYFS